MRMKLWIVALLPLWLAGCIVYPHSTQIAPAINGRVTDITTGQIIADAQIIHQLDEDITRKVHTNNAGRFVVEALKQYHWGYQVGIALNHSLPHAKGEYGTKPTDLYVSSPGYMLYHAKFLPRANMHESHQLSNLNLLDNPDTLEIQLVPEKK